MKIVQIIVAVCLLSASSLSAAPLSEPRGPTVRYVNPWAPKPKTGYRKWERLWDLPTGEMLELQGDEASRFLASLPTSDLPDVRLGIYYTYERPRRSFYVPDLQTDPVERMWVWVGPETSERDRYRLVELAEKARAK